MPNATNPLGRRFVAREARVAREERAKHRASNRFWTAIQQYSLTSTASRKSTKTIKSTRLTISRRIRRIQSKKSPGGKGRFRLAQSDCVRNGLRVVSNDQTKFPKSCYFGKKSWQHFPKRRQNFLTRNTAHLASFWNIWQVSHHNALRFCSNPLQQQQKGANATPTLSME